MNKKILITEKCKCGDIFYVRHTKEWSIFSRLSRIEDDKYTSILCKKRKWYNFWKHSKEQLLTFDHTPVIGGWEFRNEEEELK